MEGVHHFPYGGLIARALKNVSELPHNARRCAGVDLRVAPIEIAKRFLDSVRFLFEDEPGVPGCIQSLPFDR
jgi:hypothetical protein